MESIEFEVEISIELMVEISDAVELHSWTREGSRGAHKVFIEACFESFKVY